MLGGGEVRDDAHVVEGLLRVAGRLRHLLQRGLGVLSGVPEALLSLHRALELGLVVLHRVPGCLDRCAQLVAGLLLTRGEHLQPCADAGERATRCHDLRALGGLIRELVELGADLADDAAELATDGAAHLGERASDGTGDGVRVDPECAEYATGTLVLAEEYEAETLVSHDSLLRGLVGLVAEVHEDLEVSQRERVDFGG